MKLVAIFAILSASSLDACEVIHSIQGLSTQVSLIKIFSLKDESKTKDEIYKIYITEK